MIVVKYVVVRTIEGHMTETEFEDLSHAREWMRDKSGYMVLWLMEFRNGFLESISRLSS